MLKPVTCGCDGARIDTHHHVFSPAYLKAWARHEDLPPVVTDWSAARSLDDMDASGVATAILSVTTPQVRFADPARARAIARESNEWAAALCARHPGRFGFFAMLPMEDTDGALEELDHALDALGAQGAGVLTSYGERWLGDPVFAPVLDELNRRDGVLYTHPSAPDCCANLQPAVHPSVVEFGTDTTRTIVDLLVSGTAARCPMLSFIFSHAGGSMPFLAERLLKLPEQDDALAERLPFGVLHELQRFFYDTAWTANRHAMSSLVQLVDASQILFGSDFPYRSGVDQWRSLSQLGFTDEALLAIGRDNAVGLGLRSVGRFSEPGAVQASSSRR